MDRSGVIKVVIAFVVGVILALGGALAFVKLKEASPVHVTPAVAQTPAAVPPPAPLAAEQNAPDQGDLVSPSAAQQPSITPEPRKQKSAAAERDGVRKTRVAARMKPNPRPVRPVSSSEPIQIAQNSPVPPAPVSPEAQTAYPPLSGQNEAQPASAPAQPQTSPQQAAVAPMRPQPHVVELAAGTNLMIRLSEPLSTEHNYSGDTFRATLDAPVIRDGFVIADKGSKVLGRVVNAQQAGRVKGVSELNLTVTEINTTDGQRIQVETNAVEKQGPTSTGTDTAKIAGGAALGALIGALGGGGKGAAIGAGAGGAAGTGVVLATRGKPAVFPSESRLGFALTKSVIITEKLNNQ